MPDDEEEDIPDAEPEEYVDPDIPPEIFPVRDHSPKVPPFERLSLTFEDDTSYVYTAKEELKA